MNVVPKGRMINKILCLLFLVVTLILLAAAGVSAFFERSDVSQVLCTLALITGAFSLFYGILWFVYNRKENRAEKILRETIEQQYTTEDSSALGYWEFILPKALLTETARKRFFNIIRWLLIIAPGMSILIWVILVVFDSTRSFLQLYYLFLFCLLVSVPGILVQWCLYKVYGRSVPSRILMFPGKLVVDDQVFSTGETREIRVSPVRIFNFNSPAVFREMLIRTDKSSKKYRIDFRTGSVSNEQPFWEEYEPFVAALSQWGSENGVSVTVSYMA